ncbi:hypothetical protein [Streptomyces clavuligerus]|uniref:Secreted protein n=1 Tax=Streptomyces clavuligerus TaxID=1901 RepID=B5GWR4_STRCL|nr:hypothetical protein [Streptomyces clavuligerus]ANW16940.1 hypothetical protein BB341_01200 [Streptomyces clavuligerus]AXU11469.1 hypothetical protein D1794_01275 [Streptomyces clavuligerus]EDY50760.1 hypothetical protein SSCG_03440 [Streptomyces clavuligerus]EFG10534.1 Hypothetical protein SCLAV_5467 [Streptomyces clavuligerus]MBY6301288.1 hypothetical protein [Streptomyces clavuligerus]
MTGSRLRKAGLIAGAAAVLTFATSTSAWANWTANNWVGNQGKLSQQWVDESYNEINFTGCDEVYGRTSVDVALWQQIDWGSDKKHDTSTFTNCFKGASQKSTATQTGLPRDSYYFEIDKIGSGCISCAVAVTKVNVDTTKAD